MSQIVTTPVMSKVHDEIDRMFNRFLNPRGLGEPFSLPTVLEPIETLWVPTLDLKEDETSFLARLEIPGVSKDDLDVQVTGDLLTITGHREKFEEKKGETYLWQEQRMGKFARTVRLPAPVATEKVEANYKDGLLTIRMPKLTPATTNKIAIK